MIFIDFRNDTFRIEIKRISIQIYRKFEKCGMRRGLFRCIETSFPLQHAFHFVFFLLIILLVVMNLTGFRLLRLNASFFWFSKWLQRIFTWIVFCSIFFSSFKLSQEKRKCREGSKKKDGEWKKRMKSTHIYLNHSVAVQSMWLTFMLFSVMNNKKK